MKTSRTPRKRGGETATNEWLALANAAIDEKGLSLEQLVNELEKRGKSIVVSSLSRLLTGKSRQSHVLLDLADMLGIPSPAELRFRATHPLVDVAVRLAEQYPEAANVLAERLESFMAMGTLMELRALLGLKKKP